MIPRLWIMKAALCIGVSLSLAHGVDAQDVPASHSLMGVLLDFQARGNQFAGLPPDAPVGDVTLLANLAVLEASTAPYGTSTGGLTAADVRRFSRERSSPSAPATSSGSG